MHYCLRTCKPLPKTNPPLREVLSTHALSALTSSTNFGDSLCPVVVS